MSRVLKPTTVGLYFYIEALVREHGGGTWASASSFSPIPMSWLPGLALVAFGLRVVPPIRQRAGQAWQI